MAPTIHLPYVSVSHAARNTGAARTSIQSAMDRGEITTYQTEDGLRLVVLDEVRQWHRTSHRPHKEATAS